MTGPEKQIVYEAQRRNGRGERGVSLMITAAIQHVLDEEPKP